MTLYEQDTDIPISHPDAPINVPVDLAAIEKRWDEECRLAEEEDRPAIANWEDVDDLIEEVGYLRKRVSALIQVVDTIPVPSTQCYECHGDGGQIIIVGDESYSDRCSLCNGSGELKPPEEAVPE